LYHLQNEAKMFKFFNGTPAITAKGDPLEMIAGADSLGDKQK
jgi:hypothetical protein